GPPRAATDDSRREADVSNVYGGPGGRHRKRLTAGKQAARNVDEFCVPFAAAGKSLGGDRLGQRRPRSAWRRGDAGRHSESARRRNGPHRGAKWKDAVA